MFEFSNGLKAQYIEVMYLDEVVARIDFEKSKLKRTNYLGGVGIDAALKNPLIYPMYDSSGKIREFLKERLITETRDNRSSLFPDWVKTSMDELYLTNGRDFDDFTWLRFMPIQKDKVFDDVKYW